MKAGCNLRRQAARVLERGGAHFGTSSIQKLQRLTSQAAMMANWLERAKREISKSADPGAVVADDRSLTAALAARDPDISDKTRLSNGSNDSVPCGDFS